MFTYHIHTVSTLHHLCHHSFQSKWNIATLLHCGPSQLYHLCLLVLNLKVFQSPSTASKLIRLPLNVQELICRFLVTRCSSNLVGTVSLSADDLFLAAAVFPTALFNAADAFFCAKDAF